MRVGSGYDIHPLVPGRPLILGGVAVPHGRGLGGHSDADVLCHAVMDALLGAAALGDIGEHFPDTDPAYRDASSIQLLRETAGRVRRAGYAVANIDATLVLESPKLAPFKKIMANNLAEAVGLPPEAVSVKAKTNERFDSAGRGDAAVAYAVVCLEERRLP